MQVAKGVVVGAAKAWRYDLYLLGSKLNGVASDPARLKRMQKQSRAYGNAGACFSIAEHIARGEYGYIELLRTRKKKGD